MCGGWIRSGVAQSMTDSLESHSLTEQLQGKRMSQTMKACLVNLDFGGSHGPRQSVSYSGWAKRTCGRPLPKKQMTGRWSWACIPQVGHQRVTNLVGQW